VDWFPENIIVCSGERLVSGCAKLWGRRSRVGDDGSGGRKRLAE
jgi:hypothetical protein